MPPYGYRCPACGDFEARAPPERAGAPAPCPACGTASGRTFSAPGVRSAARARALDRLGPTGVERADRALEGRPSVGALPAGVPAAGGRPVARSPRIRPWAIGH
jgi:putative FmdB family regulatory protein